MRLAMRKGKPKVTRAERASDSRQERAPEAAILTEVRERLSKLEPRPIPLDFPVMPRVPTPELHSALIADLIYLNRAIDSGVDRLQVALQCLVTVMDYLKDDPAIMQRGLT